MGKYQELSKRKKTKTCNLQLRRWLGGALEVRLEEKH
jgi:hypothetical protein